MSESILGLDPCSPGVAPRKGSFILGIENVVPVMVVDFDGAYVRRDAAEEMIRKLQDELKELKEARDSEYGKVSWSVEDIQKIDPDLDSETAEKMLEFMSDALSDDMTTRGRITIDTLWDDALLHATE